MENEIKEILNKFKTISLKEVHNKLIDRIDRKYIVNNDILIKVLQQIINDYYIVINNNTNMSMYSTVYFDTNDHQLYLAHKHGIYPRSKLRTRYYNSSGDIFVEIKTKYNNGFVKKLRRPIKSQSDYDSEKIRKFINKNMEQDFDDLERILVNTFSRITLVSKDNTERVTIDRDIRFFNIKTKKNRVLNNLVIIEIKSDKHKYTMKMKSVLNKMNLHTDKFSKYFIGLNLTI